MGSQAGKYARYKEAHPDRMPVNFFIDRALYDEWRKTYPMGTKVGKTLVDLIRDDLQMRKNATDDGGATDAA